MRVTVRVDWRASSAWPAVGEAFTGHIFQTRDYLDVWRRTIGAARGAQLLYVTASLEQGPLLFLPLALERRRGVRVLSFPDGGVADYGTALFKPGNLPDGASMAGVWRAIIQALPPADIVTLGKIPDMIGRATNPFRYVATSSDETHGHAVTLDGDWTTFSATRLRRAKDSRRKRRRLAEIGPVQFRVASTREEAGQILDAMIAQKTHRYLSRRGADGFDRPGYRSYFSAMTDAFFSAGVVHLSELRVGDSIVAAHWGLRMRDRFYCLMLSFDENGPWARYSPGRLLVEDMIAWCYAQAVGTFDMGFGDAPWKDQFCDETIPMSKLVQPLTFAGLTYIGAANVYRALNRKRVIKTPSGRPPEHQPSAQ